MLRGGATKGVHVEGRATRLFTIGGDPCDVGKHCVNYNLASGNVGNTYFVQENM